MGIQNYTYLALQFIACLFALYNWKSYKNTALWIFLPFLIYSLINEFLATYIALNFKIRLLYNVYIMLSFLVYLYWFDRLLNLKMIKWILLGLFIVAVVYDIYSKGVMRPLLKTAVNFQSIMVLVCSFVFFAKLLRSKEVVHYQQLPAFWIVSGMLIFYIGYVPLSLMVGMGFHVDEFYALAIILLNLLLYGCYIIGFYVAGKR